MNLYTRGRHKAKAQSNAQNKYTSTQKGSTKQFEVITKITNYKFHKNKKS